MAFWRFGMATPRPPSRQRPRPSCMRLGMTPVRMCRKARWWFRGVLTCQPRSCAASKISWGSGPLRRAGITCRLATKNEARRGGCKDAIFNSWDSQWMSSGILVSSKRRDTRLCGRTRVSGCRVEPEARNAPPRHASASPAHRLGVPGHPNVGGREGFWRRLARVGKSRPIPDGSTAL